MATLREYFTKDFTRLLNVAAEHKATLASGNVVPYTVRVHLDFDSCAKFVSIHIPSGIDPIYITKFYADEISHALKILDSNVEVGAGFAGLGEHTTSKELVFTGRLFVYAEDAISENAAAELAQHCVANDIRLVLRGATYVEVQDHYITPEAFVSHDTRDKKEIAEPIAVGLQKLMCPVWYDEFSLKVGAPLRESIERGIKAAKTCIVVLSPNFFSNNGWTKAEFDSICAREIIEQQRVILPVWHGVSKREVYDYSPRLADRVGVSTELGIDEVVRRLHVAIRSHETENTR